MASQILRPNRDKSTGLQKLQTVGQVGLGVAGLIGSSGASAALGGLNAAQGLGNLGSKPTANAGLKAPKAPSAIDRRLGTAPQLPIEERIQQLQVAEALVPTLPREVQDEVFPVLAQTIALTANEYKQQRGVG